MIVSLIVTKTLLFLLVFKARSPAPTSTPGEYISGVLIATYLVYYTIPWPLLDMRDLKNSRHKTKKVNPVSKSLKYKAISY